MVSVAAVGGQLQQSAVSSITSSRLVVVVGSSSSRRSAVAVAGQWWQLPVRSSSWRSVSAVVVVSAVAADMSVFAVLASEVSHVVLCQSSATSHSCE